jgi:NAD(P)-dependent dehydrogenase (short-subunit alcohol dehydrogenase family)
MQLAGKVILVTGSSTGIGEAMARRFVAEGARVVVHGTRRGAAEQVASSLGPSAAVCIGDLSDPTIPADLIRFTMSTFGQLDGLVNNAAVTTRANLHTTTQAVFDRILAINLRAPLLLIQAALPHLVAARGSVLNIGSINGYCGEPNLLPYSISKGGLMTLSRNLADSLCYDGVRVNHINVGWVLTPNENALKISEGLPPDWGERPPRGFAPSGRLIRPEEVAALAVYWMSDESRPISGSVMELEQYPVIGRNPPKESL